ncbi:hypothetical protein B0G62_101774 [Paraburkholderia eburnea]|uniref:Uncharacterized protein n=1 Tax=Paraburkholderia eburnea TaxID=1189126 RepID=A0A2S4MNQ2_9BURK|nr:hypothetical protein [Paraburkholderia eburnea]POR56376.1 hypothetical protein B0G62_101774 [Paraburkholderia eburnea]PRZ27503.1 hypothetical protein BX588_101773 [Paraburkholderia eburnea]
MFALKLTLVPLFLLFVSMSGKLWDPRVAGWLVGLSVVAGPILFLLVIEHGAPFVIALLRGVVSGRFGFAAFCLTLAPGCSCKPQAPVSPV